MYLIILLCNTNKEHMSKVLKLYYKCYFTKADFSFPHIINKTRNYAGAIEFFKESLLVDTPKSFSLKLPFHFIFTPQPLRAVGVLFSPMVSGWAGGWAGGGK